MVRVVNGCQVIGLNPTEFESNGDRVYGYTLFFSYPLTVPHSSGVGCGRVYCPQKYHDNNDIDLGSEISVAYVDGKYQLVI